MKTALIGVGMVAETHLLAIRDASPAIRLEGVLGRDPDRATSFAAKASDLLGYSVGVFRDAETLARSVDFATIVTPPDARQDLVQIMVAAGCPVLMEKPVERTSLAARKIVSACAENDVPLGIVLQHRARAASQALKSMLAGGALGEIATVDLRVPWWRDQSYYDAPGRGTYARDGGGVMINQAIHTLDLLMWLLGPMASLQAIMHKTPLHQMEAEDWAGALFEMENGAVGSLTATTAAFPGNAESITMQGTRAAAHLASGVLTIRYSDGRAETVGEETATGGGADPMAFTHGWHQTILENFAAALTKNEALLASGESALMAHAVIDTMERAAKTGKNTKVPAL